MDAGTSSEDEPKQATAPVKKPRKPLSEEALAKLAEARKKALQKKRELKAISDKEKKTHKQIREEALRERLERVEKLEKVVQPKKSPAKPKPEPVPEPYSDDSSASEVHIRRRPPVRKKKQKKRIVYVDSSSDSSDDEIVVKRKRKAKPAPKPKPNSEKLSSELSEQAAADALRHRLDTEKLRLAMHSLFPTHQF